jgi:hypothetical protein
MHAVSGLKLGEMFRNLSSHASPDDFAKAVLAGKSGHSETPTNKKELTLEPLKGIFSGGHGSRHI